MKNVRTLSLGLLAILALGAITAGAAQGNAPRWTVSGKTIGSAETATVTGETTGTPTLGNASVTFTSTSCTSHGNIKGSAASSPGTWTGTLLCHEVKVAGAAACVVKSAGQPAGTITTTNLTGTLVWLEKTGDAKVGMLYQGDGSTHLFTYSVEGCALAGVYPVEGELLCEVLPVTKDEVNLTKNCPSTPILKYWDNTTPERKEKAVTQLKLKAAKATIVAHFINLHLTGNLLWGVEPG